MFPRGADFVECARRSIPYPKFGTDRATRWSRRRCMTLARNCARPNGLNLISRRCEPAARRSAKPPRQRSSVSRRLFVVFATMPTRWHRLSPQGAVAGSTFERAWSSLARDKYTDHGQQQFGQTPKRTAIETVLPSRTTMYLPIHPLEIVLLSLTLRGRQRQTARRQRRAIVVHPAHTRQPLRARLRWSRNRLR